MNEIAFPGTSLQDLREQLLASAPSEAAAILFAGLHARAGKHRLLVRETLLLPESGYLRQGPSVVSIAPQFLNKALKRARADGWSLVMVHTHPFADEAWFSVVDDEAEKTIVPVLRRRAPDRPSAFAVLTEARIASRIWYATGRESKPADVSEIGPRVRLHRLKNKGITLSPELDRSVRALGIEGQSTISELKVGIVGLGGLGSIVVQELVHSGVRQLLLIDYDVIERTNLNRVVGSTRRTIGKAKVEVAAERALEIQPQAKIERTVGDVADHSVLRQLLACDVVFCCTDSHGSRAVLNQIAYQYFIPTFDLGVHVAASDDEVQSMTGRVQMLAPGLPCLVCHNLLDPELVRRDLMTEAQRTADPYIVGAHIPQPAVMSLNGTVASMGVTMMLSAIAGLPVGTRHQIVLFHRGTVRSISSVPEPQCIVCSPRGAFGRGDLYSLPGRPIG